MTFICNFLAKQKGWRSFLFWFRGCYFQEGMDVKLEMQVEDAYKQSIQTVMNWIQDTLNPSKTQIFFRTLAPVHFRFVWRLKWWVSSTSHILLGTKLVWYVSEEEIGKTVETVIWKHFRSLALHWCLMTTGYNSK